MPFSSAHQNLLVDKFSTIKSKTKLKNNCAEHSNWDISKIPEIKNTPQNADWYDYRLKITEEATLRADLKDAGNCIKAANFLPLSRGTKKHPKSVKNKDKNEK